MRIVLTYGLVMRAAELSVSATRDIALSYCQSQNQFQGGKISCVASIRVKQGQRPSPLRIFYKAGYCASAIDSRVFGSIIRKSDYATGWDRQLPR